MQHGIRGMLLGSGETCCLGNCTLNSKTCTVVWVTQEQRVFTCHWCLPRGLALDHFILVYFILFYIWFYYLFQWESEHRGEGQRKNECEKPKQTPPPPAPWSWEPGPGLHPGTWWWDPGQNQESATQLTGPPGHPWTTLCSDVRHPQPESLTRVVWGTDNVLCFRSFFHFCASLYQISVSNLLVSWNSFFLGRDIPL